MTLPTKNKIALAAELTRTIADDRYPLSPRIRTLQGILDKLEPRPAHEPLSPLKRYEPRSKKPLPGTPLKSYPGPPMTLGSAAAAHLTFIVWCRDLPTSVEPDPAEMAERYGAETTCQTGATS